MDEFDGKLTSEEKKYLQEHGVSDKKIKIIEEYLTKYKEGLTSYVDLVGDDLKPGSMFYFNMKHFGHLLELSPESSFSDKISTIKPKIVMPLIRKVGPLFLKSPQVFEDRNELMVFSKKKHELEDQGIFDVMPTVSKDEYEKDKGITLPKEPVIWTLNHGFKDDVLATVLASQRSVLLLFGSVPQFYNTFDGVIGYLIGSIIINRKCKASRAASIEKLKKGLSLGLDGLFSPEGVWNKNPHKLVEEFWPGVFRTAKEYNVKLVPIVHYIYDPTQRMPKKLNPIHTVVDDPVDISYMPEKEALEYYREIIIKWYYMMIEKYGQATREQVLNGYDNMADAYEEIMQAQMKTVERYDTKFEATITYHPKGVVKPQDVFEPIANIEPTKENILHKEYAKQLVKTRKKEDYQSRF